MSTCARIEISQDAYNADRKTGRKVKWCLKVHKTYKLLWEVYFKFFSQVFIQVHILQNFRFFQHYSEKRRYIFPEIWRLVSFTRGDSLPTKVEDRLFLVVKAISFSNSALLENRDIRKNRKILYLNGFIYWLFQNSVISTIRNYPHAKFQPNRTKTKQGQISRPTIA